MTAPVHTLHLAWTADGNTRVLECTCGAQMTSERGLAHLLRDHGKTAEYARAAND